MWTYDFATKSIRKEAWRSIVLTKETRLAPISVDIAVLISILVTIAYVVLFGIVWAAQRNIDRQVARGLFPFLGAVIVGSIITLLPEDFMTSDEFTPAALLVYTVNIIFILYGYLTLLYLKQPRGATIWLGGTLLWGLGTIGLNLVQPTSTLGEADWFLTIIEEVELAGLITLAGWILLGSLILAITFWQGFSARLPEVVNQVLFWAGLIPLVLMGSALNASGVEALQYVGWILQISGVGGVIYATLTPRVFDIRGFVRSAFFSTTMIITVALIIFVGLLLGNQVEIDNNVGLALILGIIAVMTAILAVPLGLLVQNITRRLLHPDARERNTSSELRKYTDAFMGVVDLGQLAEIVKGALRDVVRVRRGGLLMVSEGEQHLLKITPYPIALGEISQLNGWLSTESPIYVTLFHERKPALQYDLDFAQGYKTASPTERDYFRQLTMAAYAPIIVQERLIGILACGTKISDDPFYPQDLHLIATIANQVGFSLGNARLVDNLKRREIDIAESNKRLEAAKRQLEALDAVKTDFITIASHELRTPLAQIRGHTDIIEALNEQGVLDKDQLQGLTNNLRKAADRLESLIGDMLDVSQLDLSAMDLRFSQTTIENVVRLAIEPLQESIRNRKQSLTARGLRGLPAINADMQRLVQAIRNVVLNAVKYTPDGGRIDIVGALQVNEQSQDEILIKIKDTGIGIDPKHHEAIFEKFFRVGDPGLHSTGKTKFMGAGPGLGLTIARGVINGHGGKIWVESEGFNPDALPGATFNIIMPVKPPEERRNISFGTITGSTPIVRDAIESTRSSPLISAQLAQQRANKRDTQETEKPFIEENRTILNPAASRAGLAAAAKAAAEKAKAEVDAAPPDETPDDDTSSE